MFTRFKRFGALMMVLSLLLSITVIPPAQAVIDETLTLGFGEPQWVKVDDEGEDVEDPDTYSGTMRDAVYVPITVTGAGDTVGVASGQLYLSFDKDVLEYFYMDVDNVPPVKVGKNTTTMALNGVDDGEIHNANGYVAMVPNSSKTHTVQSGETLVTVEFILKDSSAGSTTLTLGAMVDGALSTELVNKIVTAEDDSGYKGIRTADPLTLALPGGGGEPPVTEYTVTLKAGEGTGSDITATVKDGEEYTLPECSFTAPADKTVFDGWQVNGEVKQAGDKITVNGDVTATAQWKASTPATFTISFHANGGKGTMEDITVEQGQSVTLPLNTFTNEGFVFVGWQDLISGYDVAVDGGTITPDKDITLKAHWEKGTPATFTISFHANGGKGTMEDITVEQGQSVTLPLNTFTNEGFVFVGWQDLIGGLDVAVDGGTITPDKDITLKAHWEKGTPKTFTISFNANGGKGTMEDITVEQGQSATLPANEFTYEGYTFIEWVDAAGNAYADQGTVTPTADLTLMAGWKQNEEPETCTISFEANGGEGTMESIEVEKNKDTALPANTFTKEGNKFTGWKDADGNEYADKASVTPTADMTLTAQWEKEEGPGTTNTFTIRFNANGGTGTMEDVTVKDGQSATLPANAFTKEGNKFTGWKNADGNEYADKASVTPTADMTLTAQWEKEEGTTKTFTIHFNANGGTGTMEDVTVEDGQSATLPANTFAKEGSQFTGWKDADGNEYADKASVTPTADMTLTAQWKEKEYTVTFDAGEGKGTAFTQKTEGGKITLPDSSKFTAPASKPVFAGWQVPGYTGVQQAGNVVPVNADMTVTARWAGKNGCYVATAVYGSYDCPEVWTLRRFRDNKLAKTWYGRLFIHLYYAISPTAVRLFGETEWFQNFWRARLDKMVKNLQADGFASTPYQDRAW